QMQPQEKRTARMLIQPPSRMVHHDVGRGESSQPIEISCLLRTDPLAVLEIQVVINAGQAGNLVTSAGQDAIRARTKTTWPALLREFCLAGIEEIAKTIEALLVAKSGGDVGIGRREPGGSETVPLQDRSQRFLMGSNAQDVPSQRQSIARCQYARQRVISGSASRDSIFEDDALIGERIKKWRGGSLTSEKTTQVCSQTVCCIPKS